MPISPSLFSDNHITLPQRIDPEGQNHNGDVCVRFYGI